MPRTQERLDFDRSISILSVGDGDSGFGSMRVRRRVGVAVRVVGHS